MFFLEIKANKLNDTFLDIKHEDLSVSTCVNLDKVKLIQDGTVPVEDEDFQHILSNFHITKGQIEEMINSSL